MTEFKRIFIHCSGTDYGSSKIIREWHLRNGWNDIGYHFVVSNGMYSPDQKSIWASANGSIEAGRKLDDDDDFEPDEIGSHVYGFNSTGSVGICVTGKHHFREPQIVRLRFLVNELCRRLGIPDDKVFGHYEAGSIDPRFATTKTCPNMPMPTLRKFFNDEVTLFECIKDIRELNEKLMKP